MARFGQLFLQKGNWHGKQLLPKNWVEEASTLKIIQHPELPEARRNNSDWEQGYCYQMWRCRYNAYRGDGAFGQFIIVMPEQDAVVILTAESSDLQGEINLVWQHLLPAMQKNKLPENPKQLAALRNRSASLQLPILKNVEAVTDEKPFMHTYSFQDNDRSIKEIAFRFSNQQCIIDMQVAASNYNITFDKESWKDGTTTRPGPYLLTKAKHNLKGLSPFKIAGSYTWTDANTLTLTLRYVESPHTETFICHFSGDKIAIDIKNTASASEKLTLNGTVKQ